MNNRILQSGQARRNGFDDSGQSTRHLAVYLGISFFAHTLFFLASIWLVQFEMPGRMLSVVHVDLVSFGPGDPGGGGAAPAVAEDTAPAPVAEAPPAPAETAPEPAAAAEVVVPTEAPPAPKEPEPVPMLAPDVSLKAKPKNLQELMAAQEKKPPEKLPEKKAEKPAPDPEKALEKARQELAEKEAARTEEQLASAMERLARSVAEQDSTASPRGSGTGTGGGPGRPGGTPLDLYKMVLQSAIQQNWVFNELLAGMDQNLEVRILVKILKNGDIRDIIYDKRSGNQYLDQSARRAIERAAPLPPLPRGMATYDVVVIFTPKGMR